VGQVATFAVNAAFVESVAFVENGRTVREVFLATTNIEHEAGQAASTVFQVFSMTQPT